MTLVELIASIKSEGAKKTQDDLNKVGKAGKQAGKDVEQGTDVMAGGAKRAAIAAGKLFAAYKGADILIGLIAQSTQLAARYETLGTVMNTVTGNMGISAQASDGLADSVRQMGITLHQSRNTIISMAQAQLDLSKASELARVSQDAAVIAGVDSSQALGRIIHGIKAGQTETLRTIGINVNFQRSYQKLALQLDKNASALTESEKAQARMNAVMEQGERIAGAYEAAMTTAGKKVTSLARQQQDLLTKFGEIFTPAYAIVIDELTDALKGMNSTMDDTKENGAMEALQEDMSQVTAATITMVKTGFLPAQAAFNFLQATTGSLAAILKFDMAYGANEVRDAMNDMAEAVRNADSAYDTMRDNANTFTFAFPSGFDEFGVQQFKLVTETFEELDDSAREAFAKISAYGKEQKATADGVRASIEKTDSELSDSVTAQLNAAKQRNATLAAEGAYQKQLAEFEAGRLKNVNQFLEQDQDQLANDVKILDNAISFYKVNTDIEGSEEALADVQQRRAKIMGDLLLLQNGFTAELKQQLLEEAKRTDVITAEKQLRDMRHRVSLVGMQRSEVAALTAQRKLENKGLVEQGAEMANLIRLEHQRRAESSARDRLADIQRETALIGASAREHAIATAAIQLHKDGYHDYARAVEEALDRQIRLQERFRIDSAADPSIERNKAIKELNMLYEEGERDGLAYTHALEEINGEYIRQIELLGRLTQLEQRALARTRSRIELESAENATAFADRRQTRLETMIKEDALTEKRIVSLQAEIEMLRAKDEQDEVLINAAESRLERLKQQADSFDKEMRSVTEGSMQVFFQDMLDGTQNLEDAFDKMVDNFVANMARMAAEALAQKAIGALASSFGGQTGYAGNFLSIFGLEKGGVMTSAGQVPLKKYASGGVADTPQLAVFGEGSTPEAYVPLPDGRRIPVAMDEKKDAVVQPINVTVKVSEDTSTKSATQAGYRIGRAVSAAQRRNG